MLAVETFVQCLARYPQEHRRHTLIAIGAPQCLSDQRPLGLFERRELLRKPRRERRR